MTCVVCGQENQYVCESQGAVWQPAMSRSYNDGLLRSLCFHDDKQRKSTRLERRTDRTRAGQFFVLVLCTRAVCHDKAYQSSLYILFPALNWLFLETQRCQVQIKEPGEESTHKPFRRNLQLLLTAFLLRVLWRTEKTLNNYFRWCCLGVFPGPPPRGFPQEFVRALLVPAP